MEQNSDKQERGPQPLPAQLYTTEAKASKEKTKAELNEKDPANAKEAMEKLLNESAK